VNHFIIKIFPFTEMVVSMYPIMGTYKYSCIIIGDYYDVFSIAKNHWYGKKSFMMCISISKIWISYTECVFFVG